MEHPYKIGTEVVIVDAGDTYNSSREMAELLELNCWVVNEMPTNGCIFEVVGKTFHVCCSRTIVYAIECINSGQQFLIEAKGVEVVQTDPKKWPYPCFARAKGASTCVLFIEYGYRFSEGVTMVVSMDDYVLVDGEVNL
jgi:hypothetical protein